MKTDIYQRMPARTSRSRPLTSAPREERGACAVPRRCAVALWETFERAATARGPQGPTKPRKVHGFINESI
jgi:hypothetical protein